MLDRFSRAALRGGMDGSVPNRVFAALLLWVVAGAVGVPRGAAQTPLRPHFEDLSPNQLNATEYSDPSTAGVALAIAGDDSLLYTIALNAGVWRSVARAPWVQLSGSPPHAVSIAVDPNDGRHVAVGERAGDSVDFHRDHSGLWESFDAGDTWTYVLDPRARGCDSQAVPAVVFSGSTLLAATTCGVAVRAASQTDFDFPTMPANTGAITAFAVAESRIWARTSNLLLVSTNGGVDWVRITAALPGAVTFHGNDEFTLAGFDSAAFMVATPVPEVEGEGNNRLLRYDVASDSWSVQNIRNDDGNPTGDGTGFGNVTGRRFLKSWVLNDTTLQSRIGDRLQLFFCAGQELYRAKPAADGTLDFLLVTPASGDSIHADFWDVHLAQNLRYWVGNDGGMFTGKECSISSGAVTCDTSTREAPSVLNDGLHTHHIHDITVVATDGRSRLLYPTQDNEAWYRDNSPVEEPPAEWQHGVTVAEADWSIGDAGAPQTFVDSALQPSIALYVRRPNGFAQLTAFGETPPKGADFSETQRFALNNDVDDNGEPAFNRPTAFAIVQTLRGESPLFPLLDIVMLTHLPLRWEDASHQLHAVDDPVLGQPNPGGGPVLLRNQALAADPDINHSKGAGWRLEAGDIPAGSQRFWVSGGHQNPVYYVLAACGGTPCLECPGVNACGTPSIDVLFKRRGPGTGWEPIIGGLLRVGSLYGPAFVNPYDPDHLFIVTPTSVQVSRDGGASFDREYVLTALVTGFGRFPITGFFGGANFSDVIVAPRAKSMATLNHMMFNPEHPHEVVAASPYTSAFFYDETNWRSLARYLPRPRTAVSGVGIDFFFVYAAMEGRSLVGIADYRRAPLAFDYLRVLARLVATDDSVQPRDATMMERRLERIQLIADGAEEAAIAGDATQARHRLRRAIRSMISFGFRLRSLTARKRIPAPTRDRLLALARTVEDDLRALLATVTS